MERNPLLPLLFFLLFAHILPQGNPEWLWWREVETSGWKAPKTEGGNLPLLLEYCDPERLGENTHCFFFFLYQYSCCLALDRGRVVGSVSKGVNQSPRFLAKAPKKGEPGIENTKENAERGAQGPTTLFINSWVYSQAVHVGIWS